MAAIQANPLCALAITPGGGHLGWCSGPGAPFGDRLPEALPAAALLLGYADSMGFACRCAMGG